MISALALSFILQSGTYQCPGDPNICDQEIQVNASNERMDYLKVEYTGWCGSSGPYVYHCSGNVCSDGNAEFKILGPGTYQWKNLGHPYQCVFEMK